MEISERPKGIKEKKRLWKERTSKEECHITLRTQDKGDLWYVDSGCSKHMIGDKNKFSNLRKQRVKSHLGTML